MLKMVTNYQRMIIWKGVKHRIEQAINDEIKSLADGMGVPESEIRKVYEEEKEKRI